MSQLNQEQALILSGGGANGALEVGVLKALAAGQGQHLGHRPLDPQIISGTSVGAINTALLASFQEGGFAAAVANLEHIWRSRIAGTPAQCGNGVFRFRADPLPYADPRCLLRNPLQPLSKLGADSVFLTREVMKRIGVFARSTAPLDQRLLEFPDISNFIDMAPLEALLHDLVDLAAIRGSARKIRIAATDWRRATLRVFANHDLSDSQGLQIIRGSAAIPGVFPPAEVGDELLVDGGVTLNTPLQPAIAARDPSSEDLVVHVIYLDPLIKDIPFPEIPNSLSTFSRLSTIFLSGRVQRNVKEIVRVNMQIRLKKDVDRRLGRSAAADKGPPSAALANLDRAVQGRIPITVHRYRPSADVIGGMLQMLDFQLDRVNQLIAAGEQLVQKHDCAASQCELGLR